MVLFMLYVLHLHASMHYEMIFALKHNAVGTPTWYLYEWVSWREFGNSRVYVITKTESRIAEKLTTRGETTKNHVFNLGAGPRRVQGVYFGKIPRSYSYYLRSQVVPVHKHFVLQ